MDKNQRIALEYELRKIIVKRLESAQEGEIYGFGHHTSFGFFNDPDDLADETVRRCMATIDEYQVRLLRRQKA